MGWPETPSEVEFSRYRRRGVLIAGSIQAAARDKAEHVGALAELAGAISFAIADAADAARGAAQAQAPDLIMSDVNLLRGERDPDAVARIRSTLGAVQFIFIAATAADCDHSCAALEKPIQPERVLAAIAASESC